MKVRYFAAAADAAGCDDETLDVDVDLAGLRALLIAAHGAEFARVLARCAVRVDGARLDDDEPVPAAATVDVLPPFAGG